ncbi:MAG: AAA family ATPase, partial [Betaproteobacteria bacterium]|nr:AAA family ATPase [Betaproteobacteria bacterium]
MHMYAQHFSLNQLPFENVPDPLFFYDHGDHARIRKQISGSLLSGRGLIVVTGPIGSGKTTLSQMIKSDFPENMKLIWMAEPPANSADLYLFLAQELGVQPTSAEKTFVMRDIRNALLRINVEGKKCLVIIDESHLMTEDVINGIRLLNNLEEGSAKLIQLLLLGQEELMEKINRPEMAPFKQRIAALETLGKMNVERVMKYITHRLQVAGGTPKLISDTGWEALSIAFNSGGTPRTINSLCDRSLNVAYERNKSIVDAKDVYEATQRMGMITDVFHYIILLNNQERKSQEPDLPANSPAHEPAPPVTPPIPPAPEKNRTVPPRVSEPERKVTREVASEIPNT